MAENWHRNLRDLQLCLQTSLFYLACQPLCPRGYIYSNPAHHPLVCGYTLSEALPLPNKENSLLAQLADWLESEFASVKARSNTCMCKDWTFCFAIFLPLHISKYYNVPYTNIQFICNFIYGYYMYHMYVTIYFFWSVQVLSPEHGPQDPIEAPAALGRQRQQAPQAWPGKWGWKFVEGLIKTETDRNR